MNTKQQPRWPRARQSAMPSRTEQLRATLAARLRAENVGTGPGFWPAARDALSVVVAPQCMIQILDDMRAEGLTSSEVLHYDIDHDL